MLKKNFLFIIVLLALVSISNLQGQESPVIVNRSTTVQIVDGKEYFFHAVLQGQTLFSIARAYGVTVDEILKENPDVKPDQLPVNQLIRIPVKQAQPRQETPRTPARQETTQQPTRQEAAPTQTRQQTPQVQTETIRELYYTTHVTKRRETVYGISRMYNITEAQLIEHNPEIRTGLRIGMTLRIPQYRQVQQTFIEYRVPPQQTLFSISREFGVSIDDLEKYNPELVDGLKAGQMLRIPFEPQMPTQPPFAYEPQEEQQLPTVSPPVTDPYCENPELKRSYDVALLIPLYLENLSGEEEMSQHAREQSFQFLEYYEGIVLALDSMRARGANIRLTVIDVCESEAKARSAIWNHDLASKDLIIGPFLPNVFPIVANFARQHNIPIVYPIYSEDRNLIRQYPNMFQATPAFQTRMNEVAAHIVERFPEDNIVLVHNNQQGIMNLISGFKQNLNNGLNRWHFTRDSINLARLEGYFFNGVYVGERVTNVYVLNDSLLEARKKGAGNQEGSFEKYQRRDNVREIVYSRDGLEKLKGSLDPNRRNIVISLMGGEALITNYTRELNQLRDTFDMVVFGVPQWRDYRSVDNRYLMNLRVHIFDTEFIDYQNQDNINFIRRYRNINHVEPGPMAFAGMKTGMYFFTALMQYGSQFHRCIEFINYSRSYTTPFNFYRPYEGGGWENQFVYIFTYRNFQLIDVRDPKNRMITNQQR